MKKNTSLHFEKVEILAGNIKRAARQLTVLILWAMIIAWISSCAPTGTETVTPPPVTEPPTTPPPITEPPVTEPPTTPPPTQDSCTGDGRDFTCQGLDHTITVSGVPDGFKPNMLPLTKEQADELRNRDRKGTECIFVVVGNLAFYDQDNNLVPNPTFKPAVLITYTFNDQDMQAYQDCQQTVIKNKPELAGTEFEPVPVYFFNDVWQPFKDGTFSFDDPKRTVTIKFTSWGDQQVGGGTRP